jgi:hypothetical protein
MSLSFCRSFGLDFFACVNSIEMFLL